MSTPSSTNPTTSPQPTTRDNSALDALLKSFEGLVLTAVPDPLSHGEPWTNGYGHTGPDVYEGQVIDQAQADAWLVSDRNKALAGAATLQGWPTWAPARQDALATMVFNLGLHGIEEFDTFLGYMAVGKYSAAALDLQGTLWYKQVGTRAIRTAHMIATGGY